MIRASLVFVPSVLWVLWVTWVLWACGCPGGAARPTERDPEPAIAATRRRATPPAAAATAVVPDAALPDAAVLDATVAVAPTPPPPACIPRGEPAWTCPEVAVAAQDDHAIVCFRERCGAADEVGCVLVEPRTGRSLGGASWPAAHTPEVAPASPFELFAEGRAIAVCKDGTCNRVHDALPPGTHDVASTIVNAAGTQLFVDRGDDTASTFDVGRDRRLAEVSFRWGEGPPPPTGNSDLVYFGRGILIGDFDEEGTIDRAVDPVTGHWRLLEKPWARLPGDLLVHFEAGPGAVELIDFDAHLAIVAKRPAGKPHQPTEAVLASIVTVGANALVVTQDPPATLFVDSKRRTISRSRALPLCP